MDNQIDNIISKTEELANLLRELKTSNEAEKYRYVLKFEYSMGDEDVYSLYDNETQKVKIDRLDNIKSWLNIRGVSDDTIYKVDPPSKSVK